ncbi:GNAT family N-acetyltransferase [Neoroseomonas lacus]|uniref:N-acetyltransferase GCN5 n=1 Tax=Neoroseomonas lacus TaxID=287609 RepID=A0A917NME2_9PROT|nr:GNAT family N-acetyltransferase [Neoroseomonas lacus]GGJ08892.1 N-acetyltransferase GCN5 [Neoroseomonas lacus]
MAHPLPITLHRAMAEDAATIRDVTRAAYARWVPVIGREPLPMAVDYDQALREHRFDLLRRGGETLALIETMLREDHLWIENIAVRPDAQGQGLGRMLLDHAEAMADESRRAELRLLTNAAFGSNVALYQRHGYIVTAREAFRGGVTVHMRKRLGTGGGRV